MRSDGLAPLLIGGLALAGVLAGLWAVGGPGSGQQERRDRVRMDDLRALGKFVDCVSDRAGDVLPAELGPDPDCGRDVRFSDPYTGEAYLYSVVADGAGTKNFRICAGFEAPDRLSDSYVACGGFDRVTGCANFCYEP